MSVNILDLTKSHLTGGVIEKIAGFLGEDSSNVKSALNGIFPTLLGSVMQNASTTTGAKETMDLLHNQVDVSFLSDLPSFLGDSSRLQSLLSAGTKLLPMLLGNKEQAVTNSISSGSGIKTSSVSSLLSFAAPILLGVLGKEFKTSGMGLSGLTSMLMGQKDAVLAGLPAGLSGVLNFSDLGDFKGGTAYADARKEVEEKGTSIKWLPWLIGLLVILGIFLVMKKCQKQKTEVVSETAGLVDSTKSAISTFSDTLSSKVDAGVEKLGAFFKKKLPDGVELSIPELGIESNLISFIEDTKKPVDKTTWFNFDRINFETGSAKLSAESLEQIKNIAQILKAYPKVNLKIGGYTDNTGDSALNLKLSNERAKAVKAAIEKEGVVPGRLEAEGYGKEHPVASNDTENGRAQNRRIAVRVTKK